MLRGATPRWLRGLPRAARFSVAAAAQTTAEVAREVLRLELRHEDGTRASRKLRKRGFLPGILYGPDAQGKQDKILVALERRTFERLHRKLWSSIQNQVFSVQVGDDAPVRVLMRDVQFDVVTDVPLTVNFLRFKPGFEVSVPITFLNEDRSPGLKRGGFINNIHHELKCIARSEDLPATLQADVSGMHVGDRICLEALNVPDSLEPLLPPGALVAKIGGRRGLIPYKEPAPPAPDSDKKVETEEEEEFDDWNDIF